MITPEAMREMADKLDMTPHGGSILISVRQDKAAAMLRSIAAEMEAREILVAGQEPLGAEFESIWDANRTALYEP